MLKRFLKPRNLGVLQEKQGMHLVASDIKRESQYLFLHLYALVDAQDGVVADAKFQAIAPPHVIAALDILSEMILQKNYEQLKKIDVDALLKKLECEPLKEFHLLILMLDDIITQCTQLNLPKVKETPLQPQNESGEGPVVDWHALTHKERLEAIERVIAEEVRPYVEMDEGGIDVLDLIEKEVVIAYKGACTSCFSSVGATLASIQSILQAKIHKDLTVRPDMENFTF